MARFLNPLGRPITDDTREDRVQHPYDAAGPDSRGEKKRGEADDRPEDRKKGRIQEQDDSKGAGRKHGVQRKPEDQRGRPDPQVME